MLTQQPGRGLLPSLALANGKIFVASQDNDGKPWLLFCDPSRTCSGIDLTGSQVPTVAAEGAAVVDPADGKLLVALRATAPDGGAARAGLIRCNADGMGVVPEHDHPRGPASPTSMTT